MIYLWGFNLALFLLNAGKDWKSGNVRAAVAWVTASLSALCVILEML